MSMRRASVWIVGLVVPLLVAASAVAQVFVYPRRPGQSQLRYRAFEWHYVDIRRGKNARGEPKWQSSGRLHAASSALLPMAPSWAWPAPQPLFLDQAPRTSRDTVATSTKAGQDTVTPPMTPTDDDAARKTALPPVPARPTRPARQLDWSRSGGIRLYFYEDERPIAERAAAAISRSYEELAHAFEFVPPRTVPYFLYNTYEEFLQTNLFPIQEGVLGVTSTHGLEMALPFFGDERLFNEVSTHEMAHQFTIQKLEAVARREKLVDDLVEELPLWFVEGLAEYYAQGGMDPETEMFMRDLVLNPRIDEGYALPGFFFDGAGSFLGVYKFGQARCVFLEETYGKGTLQQILERSHRLVDSPKEKGPEAIEFHELVKLVTGHDRDELDLRFETWLKKPSYVSFLRAHNHPETLAHVPDMSEGVQAMTSSPDGVLVAYRSMNMSTGRVSVRLFDHRNTDEQVLVARDGRPGVESLHPISGRNLAVSTSALAFVALRGEGDVIYWQRFGHDARQQVDKKTRRKRWDIEFDLGTRYIYDLRDVGLVAADSLAFSPAGDRLAFIGMSERGQRDVYVLEPQESRKYVLHRITRDAHGERDLAWGEPGIVYTSNATEHGRYNLFSVNPDTGDRRRLTHESRDHSDPTMIGKGRVLFVAHDVVGANLYEVAASGQDTGPVRRSRVATGLFQPSPGPGDTLWVLHYFRGGRRISRLPQAALIAEPGMSPAEEPVPALGSMSLAGGRPYRALAWQSWQIDGVFGILGAGGGSVFGQGVAQFSDRLRNHSVLVNMVAFGSWELIDGTLFYTNQEHRSIWGAGLFQEVSFRVDRTFDAQGLWFVSAERYFGAGGIVRYPLDRFRYVQAGLSAGGVKYGLTRDVRAWLADGLWNGTGRDLTGEWEASHDDMELQAEASLSAGYNTLSYHRDTGPIAGSSALIEAAARVQPLAREVGGTLRVDAEHYISIWGRTNLLVRAGAGHSLGNKLAHDFYLSSFDTLRGVPFGDPELLLGRSYLFSTAELQFPLEWLVQVSIFDLEGILGVDFGGIGESPGDVWDRRIFDMVAGMNIGLSWLVLRVHFAKPLDIGGRVLPQAGAWNSNISLAYRYQ